MTEERSRLGQVSRGVGAVAVILVAVLLIVLVVPGAIGAEASYVVLSGSMEPAIGAGDLVVVGPIGADQIEEGDVITFRDADSPAAGEQTDRVTHRVIGVDRSDGSPQFRTQGDANEDPDPGVVTPSQVIGEVWVAIPLIGYPVAFAGTRLGTILFVVVPGILLVVNELVSLYRDAVVVREDDERNQNDGDGRDDDSALSERGWDPAAPTEEDDHGS